MTIHHRDQVLETIELAMRKIFKVPDGHLIGPETSSADIDGWDSLSHSIFLMEIESAFSIELPLDRVYSAKNIGELASLIRASKPI